MRIIHIITRLMLGGAQENTLLCCEDLMRRHGDDVMLVTGPPGRHEGDLLPRARAGGVPLAVVTRLQRQIRPLADAVAYRKIKKIISRFRPDVVHTHSAKAGILGRAAATALRVPTVVHSVHGAPFHPYQSAAARGVFRQCERWAAPRCHAFICVADAMTDLMVEAGVAPREKFTTIYSGMEVEPLLDADKHRHAARQRFGYAPEHIVVGKIARLFHLKGHQYVIEAARHVIDQQPNVRFLFVGSGILRQSLESQIAAAGLADHFQFAGLIPREDIPQTISAMDIVVHASLREGLARVLPQALLAAKPAISYDVDGAREVVVNNETGYLLPPKSIEELSESIIHLAADTDLRKHLGKEGRRRCREVFRHEYMTERIRKLYVELLAKRR
jgi:glycosyltransferase involved in cell wall biosynthesis